MAGADGGLCTRRRRRDDSWLFRRDQRRVRDGGERRHVADDLAARELRRQLMSATRAAATLPAAGLDELGRRAPCRALALRRRAARRGATEAAAALSPKVQQLVDEQGLTLLEASELTEALKEKLGIATAMAMPMPAAGAAPAAAAAAAAPAAGRRGRGEDALHGEAGEV